MRIHYGVCKVKSGFFITTEWDGHYRTGENQECYCLEFGDIPYPYIEGEVCLATKHQFKIGIVPIQAIQWKMRMSLILVSKIRTPHIQTRESTYVYIYTAIP